MQATPGKQSLTHAFLLTASVALAGAIFVFDSSVPAGVAGGGAYAFVVLLAHRLSWRASTLAAAVAVSGLSLYGFQLARPGDLSALVLASRGVGLLLIWMTALGLELRTRGGGGREKLAEVVRALRLREAYFQQLIDTSRAVFVGVDAERRVIEWNREAERVYGVPKQEILGREYPEAFLAPESVDRTRAAIESMRASNEAIEVFENTIRRPDGEDRVMLWSGVLLRDAEGKVIGTFGSGMDITEQKRAEHALEERLRFEAQIADLSASLADPAVAELEQSIRDGIGHLGEAMGVDRCAINLISEEDGLTRSFHTWTAEALRGEEPALPDGMVLDEAFPWYVSKIRAGEDVRVANARVLVSDAPEESGRGFGKLSWSILGVPMIAGGEVIGSVSLLSLAAERTWSDPLVTRLRLAAGIIGSALVRRRVEERLHEISARTRAILNTASDAIVTTVKEGTIEAFNPAAERMFGYSADEVIGRDVAMLTLPVGDPRHAEALARYLTTREVPVEGGGHEGVGLRKDGSVVPLSVTLSEVDVGGRLRITGFMRDLTREKAMERRLRAAASESVLAEQRERRGLAHDLHDGLGQLLSLAGIKLGVLRGSLEDEGQASEVREVEELIGEADRRTTSLTFQLSPPVLEDVGLVAAAGWLAEDLARRYPLGVRVVHDGSPAPLDEASRVTLFRALRELLINVAKHADVAYADVRIASESGRVVVSVEDEGRGFDPQGYSERPEDTGGYGLLSLRERLEHLGGTLEIDSAPGKGTRVVATAPLDESAEGACDEGG